MTLTNYRYLDTPVFYLIIINGKFDVWLRPRKRCSNPGVDVSYWHSPVDRGVARIFSAEVHFLLDQKSDDFF